MAKQAPVQKGEQELFNEPSELESFVGYNLKRAYVAVLDDYRATLGEDGMSPRTFSALSLVAQWPNITQSELARTLNIERSGLVAIVDELEQRGYVVRAKVPGDRRVQALVPTKAGVAAHRDAVAAVRQHEARLLAHLTDAEKDTLVTLLKKIRSGRPDGKGAE